MNNLLDLFLLLGLIVGVADVILTRGRSLAGWGVTLICVGFLYERVIA